MKRGELWSIAGGAGYTRKPRPALIIQDENASVTGSVIIILISTQPVDADNLRVPLAPDEGNGLTQQSYVMIEKLLAHPRRLFGAKIGSISQEDMARVEQAVATILGLAR